MARPNVQAPHRCEVCDVEFWRPPSRPNRFCSRRCYARSATAAENGRRTGHLLKGRPSNNPHGNGGATRGWQATGRQIEGLKAGWFKRVDDPNYATIHAWARRSFTKPDACEMCAERPGRDWSSRSHGVTYSRNREDWLFLCRRCHHAYDDISSKLWRTRRAKADMAAAEGVVGLG